MLAGRKEYGQGDGFVRKDRKIINGVGRKDWVKRFTIGQVNGQKDRHLESDRSRPKRDVNKLTR